VPQARLLPEPENDMPNDADIHRLGMKTGEAAIIDIAAYRNRGYMNDTPVTTQITNPGGRKVVICLVILFFAWIVFGRG
jgi:hypothetical protein